MWLCPQGMKSLTHSEGTWLCDYTFQPKIYPILRGPDYVILYPKEWIIPFWGDLTMWLYFPAKNLSHSEGAWLCDCVLRNEFIPFWGDLTMWLYFPAKNLSHSEGTWLCDCISRNDNLTHSEGTWQCDYTFYPKIYPILRGPDYVIILSSQKSIPFWGDLTMWLYPKEWNLSHSEGTWLCDYTFLRKNLSHSEGTWLCDYTF